MARRLPTAIALGFILALVAFLPLGGIPVASAHALLVHTSPAADAILRAPPSKVRLLYSEDLNRGTSRVIVVNTANQQVDSNDSAVNEDHANELDASLPLLKAGTYVVVWRVQSADDGHVSVGSYIFRIARPDGSVPPLPAKLPTGSAPGAGGTGAGAAGGTLDGPAIAQAVATWLALLFMTLWVGGVIWEAWILAPKGEADPDLAAAATAAAARFRNLAPYVLGLLLLSDVALVLAQSAELAGGWSGLFAPQLLRAILFSSRFGLFWWLRQAVVLAALALPYVARRAGWPEERANAQAAAAEPSGTTVETATDALGIPDWRHELVTTLRMTPTHPGRLAAGWRRLTWVGRAQLMLAAALLVVFALSGHAAAVPANSFVYAIAVDMLHLLCETAWLGGLFYISVVLVPAVRALAPQRRARLLALGMPRFGAVAILSAVVLAVTGSLNTTIRLTSVQQFLTTDYGRILAVKIEFFLVMAAISAYHAFSLRPRLAAALATNTAQPAERAAGALVAASVSAAAATRIPAGDAQTDEAAASLPPPAHRLMERMEDWLRREALLGAVVLLCVALLGAYAGTLAAPATNAVNVPSTSGTSGASTPFTQTQQVTGYAVTLNVTPATFGTNTFTVTLKDAQGKPVDGASVLVTLEMLDMDMGTQATQLQAVGSKAPGSYSGQADLTMAGHWKAMVQLVPQGSTQTTQAEFRFTASNQ